MDLIFTELNLNIVSNFSIVLLFESIFRLDKTKNQMNKKGKIMYYSKPEDLIIPK